MKTFNLNIISSLEDYLKIKSEIKDLLSDDTNYTIYLSRIEVESQVDSEIIINVEFPLISGILKTLIQEHPNLKYSVETNWELSHIMNRVDIIKN